MPYADFTCDQCHRTEFLYYSFLKGYEKWPECCGRPMTKHFHAPNNPYYGKGDFPVRYIETAPPDPLDPETKMGRWIRSYSDQRRYEKELEAEGKYIPTLSEASNRLGTRAKPTKSVREERDNISRHGPEYFDAKREEDRKQRKSE